MSRDRRYAFALVLAAALAGAAFAQEDYREGTRGLGFSAGYVGGFGFSYRYFPDQGFGFHTAFIGWKSGEDSYFNLGAEPLYIIRKSRETALYLAGGLSLIATEDETELATGAGLGFAWHPRENTWTSLDLLLTAYKESILPLPQFAIHYMVW